MKTRTVHVLKLRRGLKLMWYVDENTSQRVPVVRHDRGRVRLIDSKADNLRLCDVLDAIMEERRKKAYGPDRVNEKSPRVSCAEMKVLGRKARWLPTDWAVIAFADQDIHLGHYQKSVDGTRQHLVA